MSRCLKIVAVAFATVHVFGCAATSGIDDGDGVGDEQAASTECDGPYNCKLPNPADGNANRAVDPDTGSDHWSIKAGAHLYDGFGSARGVITSSSIQINYGQRKEIGGDSFVYAFAVALDTGITASDWIRESNVLGDIGSMPTVSQHDPGDGDYETVWVVTGGDPSAYGDLKVTKSYTGSNQAATDYFTRPGDVFNLLYNLPGVGGVSTDTLPIGTHFHRSLGVTHVDIPLYYPGGTVRVGHLEFVYGHVGSRYGWLPHEILEAE